MSREICGGNQFIYLAVHNQGGDKLKDVTKKNAVI